NLLMILDSVPELTNPIALSANGNWLAGVRSDGKGAEVWNLESGKLLGGLRDAAGQPVAPKCLAFSDKAGLLAAGLEVADSGLTGFRHFDDRQYAIIVYEVNSLTIVTSWRLPKSLQSPDSRLPQEGDHLD